MRPVMYFPTYLLKDERWYFSRLTKRTIIAEAITLGMIPTMRPETISCSQIR